MKCNSFADGFSKCGRRAERGLGESNLGYGSLKHNVEKTHPKIDVMYIG
jgi:hypothetical protein